MASTMTAAPAGPGVGTEGDLRAKVLHLEQSLALERKRNEELQQQLVNVQLQAEAEEEAITLKLMRRLEQLKREKAQLAREVEQEEEFLTNTLQKRLEKVAMEKSQLEIRLLELKKQTEQLEDEKSRLVKEKIDLEATLESESEYIVNKLQVQLEKLGSEKKSLMREKTELQRQCTELHQSVDKLNKDKVRLEQDMEMEEESIVNRLQRQLETVLSSIRLIETKLEAKGITMKDLGITPFEVAAPETIRIYSRSPSSASSIGERWHSPHPALGSSPGCIPSSSGSGAGGRTARYLSRRSTEQHRMSAGGSVDMGISRATPTSSGEVTAGMSAAKNVR